MLVIGGVAIGLVLALAATRFVAHMLYEVKATDPATLLFATGILFAVAILASYLPASRASKIDPMTALRTE